MFELPALLESPPYEAVIVTGVVDAAGVNVTRHVPDDSVQVVELNCVVLPTEVENVIVPIGDEPVTVAVHVEAEPTFTGDGAHETDVDVESLLTVRAVGDDVLLET